MSELFTSQMKNLVLVDGDRVMVLEARIRHTTHVADLVGKLREASAYESPILPGGCRKFAVSNDGCKVYAIERPPTQITVNFQRIFNQLEGREFNIWIPWQLYLIKTNSRDQYVYHEWYWMKSSLRAPTTELFNAALPNEYQDGRSCMGTGHFSRATTINQLVQDIVEHYRSSSFNHDLDGHLRQIAAPEIMSFEPPAEFNGVPYSNVNQSTCTEYIYKLAAWSEQALNPHVDVCQLSYLSHGAFSRKFTAFLEGN